MQKAKSVTPYDLANRFGIRMSVARKILRDKESQGIVIPYVKESGFVAYSTPAEIQKREISPSVFAAEVFEEVSSSVPSESIIDDDMEAALTAASSAGTIVKPGKLAFKRREAGEKKERKAKMPEVIVEPLVVKPSVTEDEDERPAKREMEKPAVKKPAKKEEKKPAKKEDAKPAAKTPAKKEEKKPAKKEDAKPAAKTPAKKEEKKPAKKEDAKPAAKTPAKKEEKKPAEKKPAAAKAKKPEISDIAGVGPKTVDALKEGGFKTVAAIAKADPAKMAMKVSGVSEAKAEQFIASAKELLK